MEPVFAQYALFSPDCVNLITRILTQQTLFSEVRSNIVEWHLKRAPLVLLLARLLNKEGCYFHFLSRRLSYFSYIVWSYVLVITFGFFIFILSESKFVRFSGDSNKKKINLISWAEISKPYQTINTSL